MVKKKSKTVLEMGAEIAAKEGDIQPFVPWWKDPEKLVDAVLKDSDRRNALIAELADLVKRDKAFGRQIRNALGRGERESPGRPFYEKVMLVHHVEFFREFLKRENKLHTIEDTCDYIADHPAWFGIGSRTIRNNYYALKDDPAIRECINTLNTHPK